MKTNETLINQQINLCQLSKLKGIVRTLLRSEMERMDFEIKCPCKPGWYRVRDREYKNDKQMVSIMPSWINIDEMLQIFITIKTLQDKSFDFIYAEEISKSLNDFFGKY